MNRGEELGKLVHGMMEKLLESLEVNKGSSFGDFERGVVSYGHRSAKPSPKLQTLNLWLLMILKTTLPMMMVLIPWEIFIQLLVKSIEKTRSMLNRNIDFVGKQCFF
ncbi:hypothetical protein LXL04_016463 [Taraxacum kok-saghyz]